jgi:acid phosphatase
MGTVPFRLMLHTGDIAYDNGSLADFEGKFFGVYTDLVRSFAMFPTIGNHDSSSVFQVVFDLPRSGTRNWYSFDYGDVHFVALDTNDLGAEQAAWLDADLADTDRPWKIVYGHHPPYSSGSKHGSSLDVRNLFGPILAAHDVDLVLSGHDHNYERIEPQDGVSYIVTGGGGKGTRPVGTSAFTAFSEQVLHFVYVEIERDQLLVHAIDGDGTEFDQLAIAH